MSKKKEIWNQIRRNLESKISSTEFKTWFSQTNLKKLESDFAIIGVPNKFVANWLYDKYTIEIKKSFKTILKQSPEIHFIDEHSFTTNESPEFHLTQKSDLLLRNNLNPSMTFNRFIKGECNRFAYTSALDVANRQSCHYNPLYIYCSLGLGKTHLLNAICNQVLSKNRYYKIGYLSSDTFSSELAYSTKNDKLHEFRVKYCNLDILLFDDVQRLADRKKTQEEFLSIFNSLYEEKRQMVITGNISPDELKSINSYLKSRLGWGLIAEIQEPDHNTKIDIIKKKSEEININIPDDVIFFLSKSNNDIKNLIKNIVRLEVYTSLNKCDTNISIVKSLIKNRESVEIGIEDIKHITAGYFNISVTDLISNKKKRFYSYPRQLAMYLSRKYTNLSFKEIGDSFGNKDHSTVIYAVRRIEKYEDKEKKIRDDLKKIENLFG